MTIQHVADCLFSVIEQLARGDFESPETRLTTGERIRSWAVPPNRVFYDREPEGIVVARIPPDAATHVISHPGGNH